MWTESFLLLKTYTIGKDWVKNHMNLEGLMIDTINIVPG